MIDSRTLITLTIVLYAQQPPVVEPSSTRCINLRDTFAWHEYHQHQIHMNGQTIGIIVKFIVRSMLLELSRILRAQSVGIALANAIVFRSTVLTVLGAIGLVPWLGIEAAVCALGYIVDG